MFGLTEHVVIMNKQMKIHSGNHLSTSRKSILIIAPDVVAFVQDTWLSNQVLQKHQETFHDHIMGTAARTKVTWLLPEHAYANIPSFLRLICHLLK